MKAISVPQAGIWYPPPGALGPGHAQLAWDTLELRAESSMGASLGGVIETARQRKIKTLVLSAEDFSFAYFVNMDRLVDALQGTSVHLLCTLTPVHKRIISLWQEEVKHGATYETAAIETHTVNSPGLQTGFVQKFIDSLQPDRVTIILISPSDSPETLIQRISGLADISYEAPKSSHQQNRSLGMVEIETIRAFNAAAARYGIKSDDAKTMRDMILRLLTSTGWEQSFPNTPRISANESLRDLAGRLDRQLDEELTRLATNPCVSIIGTLLERHGAVPVS